jgi:hypothetical protein
MQYIIIPNIYMRNVIYIWNCHNETPCTAILNKQKCLFSKMEDGKVKQVHPICGFIQWEGRGYKDRVQKSEYGGNIMYENGKMRPVETILRIGEEGDKGDDGGGEFN